MTGGVDVGALRAAAEAATPGPWETEERAAYVNVRAHGRGIVARTAQFMPSDAAFIAAANPIAVLALLDALATAERRLAAVEALADEWEAATCITDGAPCSFHRHADGYAGDLRAVLAEGATG